MRVGRLWLILAAVGAAALVGIVFSQRGANAQEVGTVIVDKQTDPRGSAQGFAIGSSPDVAGCAGATLIHDDGSTLECRFAGTATIFEFDGGAGDFLLTDVICDDGTEFDPEVFGVTVTLDPGEVVRCTFINTDQRGTVIVDKQTDPRGSAQGFAIGSSPDVAGCAGATLIHDDGSTLECRFAGTATIFEFDGGAGDFLLTDVICDDGTEFDPEVFGVTVTLDPGEVVRCTFINTDQRGTVIVDKQTDPRGSAQGFAIGSSPDVAGCAGATLIHDDGSTLECRFAGTATIFEFDGGAGDFLLTDVICDDGTEFDPEVFGVTVTLDPGEVVRCTFINTDQRGTVIVDKQTDPRGSAQGFAIGSSPDVAGCAGATLIHDDGSTLECRFAGTATIFEFDGGAGDFLLTDVICDDGTEFDPEVFGVTVTLDPGEVVRCTFINTDQRGTVIVDKQTDPRGSAQGFAIGSSPDVAGCAGATLIHDDGSTLECRFAGTATIFEFDGGAGDFLLTDVICDDGTEFDPEVFGVTVTLDPGEVVRCTFINTDQRGTVIVDKQTDPRGSAQGFAIGSSPDVAGCAGATLIHDDGSTLECRFAGTATIFEFDGGAGDFLLTDVICDDGTEFDPEVFGVTVTLDPGEVVRCTFINTDQREDDVTPPSCVKVAFNRGTGRTTLEMQDTESGLASITLLSSRNATVTIPPFTVGTTDPVQVTVERIKARTQHSAVLEVRDVAGNTTVCNSRGRIL